MRPPHPRYTRTQTSVREWPQDARAYAPAVGKSAKPFETCAHAPAVRKRVKPCLSARSRRRIWRPSQQRHTEKDHSPTPRQNPSTRHCQSSGVRPWRLRRHQWYWGRRIGKGNDKHRASKRWNRQESQSRRPQRSLRPPAAALFFECLTACVARSEAAQS